MTTDPPQADAPAKSGQHWLLDKIFLNQPWQHALPAYIVFALCMHGYFSEFLLSTYGMLGSIFIIILILVIARVRWGWFDGVTVLIFVPVAGFLLFYAVGYGLGDIAARMIGEPRTVTITSHIERQISTRNRCRHHLKLNGTPYYSLGNTFVCAYRGDVVATTGDKAKFNLHGLSTFMGMLVEDVTLAEPVSKPEPAKPKTGEAVKK